MVSIAFIFRLRTLLLVLLFLFCTNQVFAQSKSINSNYQSSYSLSVSQSGKSFRFLGKIENAESKMIDFTYSKKVKDYEQWSLYFTPQLIPHIEFFYPKRDMNFEFFKTQGWGFSPAGFSLLNTSASFVQPFIRTNGSFIFLKDTFPTSLGRKLNFSFTAVLGLEKNIKDKIALSLGYQFHHISNAETGIENPGIDSNFMFFTFSILN